MTSSVACHRRPWTAPTVGRRGAWHEISAIGQNTIERRRAWHDITALGQHTRSDYVRRGMISSPLYSTHGRTTSGVACHYRLWAAQTIERHRAWHDIIAFGSTHGRMTGVACHHRRWAAHTVERRQAWYDITSLGKHTQSDYVMRHMMSPPLDSTQDRTTSGMK